MRHKANGVYKTRGRQSLKKPERGLRPGQRNGFKHFSLELLFKFGELLNQFFNLLGQRFNLLLKRRDAFGLAAATRRWFGGCGGLVVCEVRRA